MSDLTSYFGMVWVRAKERVKDEEKIDLLLLCNLLYFFFLYYLFGYFNGTASYVNLQGMLIYVKQSKL